MEKKGFSILAVLALVMAFTFMFLYIEERRKIYDKAVVELKIGNTDEAIILFRKSDNLGHKDARIDLIEIYALGIGIDPDRETALLLIKSLKKNDQLEQIESIIYSIKNAGYNDLANKDLEFWEGKLRELNERR